MEKIKQLCLLALLLIFSASCSRIVHNDLELVDCGSVVSVDEASQCVVIQSSLTNKRVSWVMSRPSLDKLSMWGLEYVDRITDKDTVYIYRDGKEFIATHCNVEDIRNINQSLATYYWKYVGEHWLWFLVVFVIISLLSIARYAPTWIKPENKGTVLVICFVISSVCSYMNSTMSARLSEICSGTITEITSTYVKLDNSFVAPYAMLDDISTHEPVKVGQSVAVYSYKDYENSDDSRVFFSTHRLNEKAVKMTQSYPEVWFMTSVVSIAMVLLAQVPCYCIEYLSDRRKKRKKAES